MTVRESPSLSQLAVLCAGDPATSEERTHQDSRMKPSYVLGFAFGMNRDSVYLIRKARPEWQAGFLNGIGGKIETGEDVVSAISRKFEEETGCPIEPARWYSVVALYTRVPGEAEVCVLMTDLRGGDPDPVSKTDEQVELHHPLHLPKDALDDLRWMLPLCLAQIRVLAFVHELP